MIWVAWRQQRVQIVLSLALVAAVAVVIAYVHFDAVAHLRDHGIEGCHTVDDNRCAATAMGAFASRYETYASVMPLVLLCLPVLLGMFAGAPLFAREFEQGTHVFALSQSVGRTRWWAVKVLVAGLPVVVAVVGLGLASAWGMSPLSYVTHGRMMTPGFETQGVVAGAYAALAFAIGATIGILSRNTVVAMAGTIAIYLLFLVGVGSVARTAYLEPAEKRGLVAQGAAIGAEGGRSVVPNDAWRVDSSYFDATGAEVSFDPSSCKNSDRNIETCLQRQGIVSLSARFHPDSHFWSFQFIESAIFVTIAVALLAAGFWGLRRRLL
ncbi:MAG: ABC transporter permease subunit [Hamadaea sp.]|nr:ABC transporter permease subunit [Hamadaea sp.]